MVMMMTMMMMMMVMMMMMMVKNKTFPTCQESLLSTAKAGRESSQDYLKKRSKKQTLIFKNQHLVVTCLDLKIGL